MGGSAAVGGSAMEGSPSPSLTTLPRTMGLGLVGFGVDRSLRSWNRRIVSGSAPASLHCLRNSSVASIVSRKRREAFAALLPRRPGKKGKEGGGRRGGDGPLYLSND